MLLGVALALIAAAPPDAEAALKRAEKALEQLDFRGAASTFERACADAACARGQVLRAYTGLATALASAGQSAKATDAFKALLFVSPDWTLPQAASPRLRDPFEVAQLFWRSRARPGLTLSTELARLEADPLGLVARIEVRSDEQPVTPGPRAELDDGGFSVKLELPAGRHTVVAQALSASGTVLLESEPLQTKAAVAEGQSPAATPAAPPPEAVETATGRALLHISASVAFDVLSRQLGVEALISVSPLAVLDLAAGAVIGQTTGVRVAVTLHLPRSYRVSPFGQLRLGLHPVSGSVAYGAGLALGASLEAGPGRVQALIAGELFRAPPGYSPWAALGFLGYELDLPFLRTDR